MITDFKSKDISRFKLNTVFDIGIDNVDVEIRRMIVNGNEIDKGIVSQDK